jgi:steroid 5-alpha reductase family enzyme
MSALVINLWICGGVTLACWLASVVFKEYSWTDRIWSVVPAVYAWVFAIHASDPRVTLVAVLITLWGARLTFNFARRGGYAPGGEDYRWAILRARMPGWAYAVFNFVFIAFYQNALLLLITLPMATMAANPSDLGTADAVAALVFLGFLAGETIADQQRWNFYKDPHRTGILDTGLYRYSRHPNYFFEIGQWWVVFAFGAIAAGTLWLSTGAGAVLLTLLFIGSTLFTESISASRHPEYADYRRTTSMLIPLPPRRSPELEPA